MGGKGPLRYKGFAQDILFTRHWRAVYIFLPCDDDALSGSQYFPEKVANGTHYWFQFLCVSAFHASADAAFLEHPTTKLEKLWCKASQTIQPYFFGLHSSTYWGDVARWKTTKVWVRGWELIKATFSPGPDIPIVDVTHRLKVFDPLERSMQRSELCWGMSDGLVQQLNPNTIVPHTIAILGL